jgi:hypothetical protein
MEGTLPPGRWKIYRRIAYSSSWKMEDLSNTRYGVLSYSSSWKPNKPVPMMMMMFLTIASLRIPGSKEEGNVDCRDTSSDIDIQYGSHELPYRVSHESSGLDDGFAAPRTKDQWIRRIDRPWRLVEGPTSHTLQYPSIYPYRKRRPSSRLLRPGLDCKPYRYP